MDNNKKTQCHFISNTHWDREWKFSAQRTRHMLVTMMDMLFDIFEKEPEYKHFHLDSQTMPIQDYLEACPEKKELVKKYVSEGKLAIGPWFCLPDQFCVGGESLVRNLLLGHKMAKEFGGVSKSGYSPFGWGQISQMPQLYSGFGINFASFYRGLNTYMAPNSEFYWEGPDGTKICASRLGQRPRYNMWYILQRPVFYNKYDGDNRRVSWGNGDGVFRFTDPAKCEYEYQYTHRKYEYHDEYIDEKAKQAMAEQDGEWTTPHRFWSNGHDSSIPDMREARMIKDCDKVFDDADVFHSTVYDFEQSVIKDFDPKSPVLKGEMRYPYTKGSVSAIFGWILSARTAIKQDNFNTERLLEYYAEPLACFASFLGAKYPQNFIDISYNWLLQNHGHDSIGACGRDVVYEDVDYRYRQSREIATCVLERAMMDVAGDIDLSSWDKNEMALVVYNPAPFVRSTVVPLELEIPLEWNAEGFKIVDEKGNECAIQKLKTINPMYQIVQDPADAVDVLPVDRETIRVFVSDIPSMGYKTLKVVPLMNVRATTPKTMLTAAQTMENEYLIVEINANGTLKVTEKDTGRVYNDIGYFKDKGEIGSPWEHQDPETNEIYTTLNERAMVSLVRTGELETTFRIVLNWAIPEGLTADKKARSNRLAPYTIETFVTLRKGQKWVEFNTNINNQIKNHYLQVAFPTQINAQQVAAQGQFDVNMRQVAKLDYSLFDEIPMSEQPMNSFVDLSDGKEGVALLNTGLKGYEADDDAQNTMYLSLLRCYDLIIYVTPEEQNYSRLEDGSQSLGKHSFRYAFMPHKGDWEDAGIWQASEDFNMEITSAQLSPTACGKNPLEKSFIELEKEGLHVSGVKRSESGEGWIVRLFNPGTKTAKNKIRVNGGFAAIPATQSPIERQMVDYRLPQANGTKWSKARLVTLEELPEKDLTIDKDGWVEVEITPKKIYTIELLG
ncbi:MAG: glycoside hydrolase family 38 C-terminal domain-containing protein [Eubacteriales bacterium]|nr:glycoside hydrolase family 38 C-terminal domain-containing protein [Eubacteriales bacterium]